jgi:putative Holliday junction resolvase
VGRVLAVDLGTRRVGLAMTDPLKLIASPLATIPYRSREKLAAELLELARREQVETVVVGLPVREDGQEGEGCRRARNLAAALERRGVQAVLWDERYSSRLARETLRELGSSARKSRGKVDRVAAALILKDYLEGTVGRRES